MNGKVGKMLTEMQIVKSLKACENTNCGECEYRGIHCMEDLMEDARDFIELQKVLLKGEDVLFSSYWENICEIHRKQEIKGKKKYGVSLEENISLTTEQRIEHLQEELIDGLKYCEHLKAGMRDNGITANDYQRAAMRTAGDNKDSYLLNGVMGLCGEAGEVIDLVKKHLYQGHDLDKEKLILECGDVAWYLALIASAIDVPLSEILQKNIDKLKERYPEGFSKERSINREDKDG
jgi:NTP pyrophosphatase (non-canonical NTP hydrolase)